MSSNTENVNETFDLLKSLLEPENCRMLIQNLDKDVLDPEQRQSLAQLSAHFATVLDTNSSDSSTSPLSQSTGSDAPSQIRKRRRPLSDDDDNDDDDDEGSEPGRRRRRVQWAPMDGLIRHTDLSTEMKAFWSENRHDPKALFTDPYAEHEPAGERLQKQITKGDNGEFLVFCVDFVERFNDRRNMDSVRVLFSYLACYDLCMKLNEGHTRNWKGNKFGTVLRRRIKNDILGHVQFADEAKEKEVLSSFETYCQRGLKLSLLCSIFGEGCLFRFATRLTDSFIDRSLKQSGGVYERVISALKETGMAEDDEATGLTEFGQSVRSCCQVRFQGMPPESDTSSGEASSSGSRG